MKPSERLNQLDSVFDLLLVVLSIITAALFQYVCTLIPLEVAKLNPDLTQSEFFGKVNEEILIGLRAFFIPLILVIGVWIANRLFLRHRMRDRKIASEFCYLLAFAILLLDFLFLLGLSFPTFFSAKNLYADLIFPFFLVVECVVSYVLVYSYETPFIYKENIRTWRQKLTRILMPIFIRTFIVWNVAWWLNYAILTVCLS